MKFDFTSIIERKGLDAIAVDCVGIDGPFSDAPRAPRDGFDVIPMWIADMNFATAPSVQEEIIRRAQHPTFGYFLPRKEYFDAIIDWQYRRNGVQGLEPKHIGYANGVLGGVISALSVICNRGDSVLVHSPTYVGFTHSVDEDNGYHLVHSPLVLDEHGVWRMDYADMEEKLSRQKIHAAILCSPHNPCGRVWERWELERAMELFKKYDVFVISDEIWSDLTLGDHKHIPTQSISEDAKMRTVAMYAPSKTFNLAGLVGSYRVIYNDWLRDRVNRAASMPHYNGMNVLSMYALIGAYSEVGEQWLEELKDVLKGNADFACRFIRENFPGVKVADPDGTYMLFVDCTQWCQEHGKTIDEVERACWDVGVALQDGRQFFGPCHLRMNLALPQSRVEEAFHRLKTYVFCD